MAIIIIINLFQEIKDRPEFCLEYRFKLAIGFLSQSALEMKISMGKMKVHVPFLFVVHSLGRDVPRM